MFRHHQNGFISLLLVAAVGVIAALWISSQHTKIISLFKTSNVDIRVVELNQVKQRLMEFALLQPEIYVTNASDEFQPASAIPAIGYFPCPDLNGDGLLTGSETTCGNQYVATATNPEKTGFVPDPLENSGGSFCDGSVNCMGFVPSSINSRHFYFSEPARYFYVFDERFSYQNNNYNSTTSKRYAPISPVQIQKDTATGVPLGLTINGQEGFIAVLIDAGSDGLDSENSDGDRDFVSAGSISGESLSDFQTTDIVVGIRFRDWRYEMAQRVCREAPKWTGDDTDFTEIDTTIPHWINKYDPTTNSYGSDLFEWGGSCESVN